MNIAIIGTGAYGIALALMFYKNKDNKYHGQYKYKIGFGGIIAEYPPNLILVINKTNYFIYKTFYKNKKKH